MISPQYDVLVVGAGYAGLTAAIGLARSGFTVAVVEAGSQVGDTNALGGVCFAESLVQPDILGPQGVEELVWERRLIERGRFATDGRRITGNTYRDAEAFRHCYTVLRPIFDRHLAALARQHRVAVLTDTTVESLIRDGRRVIGVATSRGPLYAELIFLAEGDAGHLVSREGLDRAGKPNDMPSFLYLLQQVVDLPPGVIEDRFRVGAEEGIAYEVVLRNPFGSRLNGRGLLCSNRQGLTLSVMLPAEHLGHIDGEPRQLLDWFVDMPALRPWMSDGRRGPWTATLLRTGGMGDVPYLVEDGLVVGGAAVGLGIDFPVLNLTGPAAVTGLLLSRAAARIRAEGRSFDRASLVRYYLEPLQQTRYWQDRVFLQRWPGYLRRSHVLFESGVDLLLDSASVWTPKRRWLVRKLFGWLGVLSRVSWRHWDELRLELDQLGRALRLRDVAPRLTLARILLDGALNAFRDMVRRPRPHLPPSGTLLFHYYFVEERGVSMPVLLRRWFERFRPVLASTARILHENDDTPLSVKWTRALELLARQINLFDLVAVAGLMLLMIPMIFLLAVGRFLLRRRRQPREVKLPGTNETQLLDAVRPPAESLSSAATPRIHVLWRFTHPARQAESVQGLPHVCPAGVFEVKDTPPRKVQLTVHAEKCIYCEACWRTNRLVDWGRTGTPPQRDLLSPIPARLLQSEEEAARIDSLPPRCRDPWKHADGEGVPLLDARRRTELQTLFDQLEIKLQEFDTALAKGPAAVDRPRSDHLEMLARYAQQLVESIRDVLRKTTDSPQHTSIARELVDALAACAEERTRRTWDGRFAWAAADGRRLRQHHLTGLRRLLGLQAIVEQTQDSAAVVPADWLPAALVFHGADACVKHLVADVAARRYLLETLERNDASAEPVRADLLAALRTEVRDRLASLTEKMNALPDANAEPVWTTNSSAALEIYQRHGRRLLADPDAIRALLDVPGDWGTLTQRRVLRAEGLEITETEKRLLALAAEWQQSHNKADADKEVSGEMARQSANVLAGKEMMLQTFARLEKGVDAELAIVLLRVWLDSVTTRLDQFTILVRDRLHLRDRPSDRPLVEPGGTMPLRTVEEYLAAAVPYHTGDFLLRSINLMQPRLVPEMTGAAEMDFAGPASLLARADTNRKEDTAQTGGDVAELVRMVQEIRDNPNRLFDRASAFYLAEALVVETMGRCLHSASGALELEKACTRLILGELCQGGGSLLARCHILQSLAEAVIPRWLGGVESGVRHLERAVLEFEALKADFRQRLTAVWQVFGEALGVNADVQASCFALAEAAAWLKAADSTLGRMAWFSRLCQAHERDEPALQQDVGRRVLHHCFAEIRDRVFRFDEDLAALRRGYYAPHVRAAALLLAQPRDK